MFENGGSHVVLPFIEPLGGSCFDVVPGNSRIAKVLDRLARRRSEASTPRPTAPAYSAYLRLDRAHPIHAGRSATPYYMKDGQRVPLECLTPQLDWRLYDVIRIEAR